MADFATNVGAIPHLDIAINPEGANPRTEPDRIKDVVLQLFQVKEKSCGNATNRAGLILTQIQGGITNRLYKVDCNGMDMGAGLISRVPLLVRVYGEGSEYFIDRNVDEAVFAELTELGFGIDLIATLRDGRIEQFFEGGRTLTPDDLAKPHLSTLIAQNMCEMHALNISSCIPSASAECSQKHSVRCSRASDTHAGTTPTPVLMSKLREWYQIAQSLKFDADSADKNECVKATLYASLPLERIGSDIETIIQAKVMSVPSPTVFCHNDLLAGNILVRGVCETDIVFVDVEYAAYNPRGFDIGNHFCEYSGFDYSKFEVKYPNREVQMVFLKSYLKRQREINSGSKASDTMGSDSEDEDSELEALYHECNVYALASHLFWGLWAVIQARNSAVDFDYFKYAKARFESYFKEKARIFGDED